MITGIAHTCFTVSDLGKSLSFYRDGLGLKEAFDFVNEDGYRFGVYLYVGERNFIELFEGTLEEPVEGQSFKHICLEVDDIEATVSTLRSRGVRSVPSSWARTTAIRPGSPTPTATAWSSTATPPRAGRHPASVSLTSTTTGGAGRICRRRHLLFRLPPSAGVLLLRTQALRCPASRPYLCVTSRETTPLPSRRSRLRQSGRDARGPRDSIRSAAG